MGSPSQRAKDSQPGESRPVLAFLGPDSSYSHQATLQAFSRDDCHFQPARTIGDVFEAVQRGEAALGVIPLENSTNGPVIFTFDTLADRDSRFKDILVCGEIYLGVHHYLVGRLPRPPTTASTTASTPALSSAPAPAAAALAGFGPNDLSGPGPGSGSCTPTPSDPHPRPPRAKPLTNLAHIRRIYSHPQAFGQCTAFLSTYLKSAEVFDVSSTSRAAEIVADGDAGDTWAAISSEIAAAINGLDILAPCIEDCEDNTTRFFVICRGSGLPGAALPTPTNGVTPKPVSVPAPASSSNAAAAAAATARTKSLVTFMVPHSSPGALADALDGFRISGLNLTSINSRPSLIAPFQYVFFVEFEGHKMRDPEGRVQAALERVASVSQRWRWLGSWDVQR